MEDVLKTIASAITVFLAFASLAEARETLTVYTYESFISEWGPGGKVKENFEKQCGCDLKWLGIADGVALLNRLKLEGEATEADVVLGLDTNLTAEAKATGFFAPHGMDASKLTLPIAWTDDTFLPYDFAHFAVIYDSQMMANPPQSLDELVHGDPAQKIILEDPRSSTPGLGFLLWIKSVYGANSAEAWAALKPRILTTTPGWTEAYGLFTKGEAPMVLSYTTSPAYHIATEGVDRYKAAAFSEGHYLQVEVAGLIASSKHEALAKQFLAFMTTPGFQDTIPTMNWMFPVAATAEPLPAAFGSLVKPSKTFLYPSEEVATNRRVWIAEWLNATSR